MTVVVTMIIIKRGIAEPLMTVYLIADSFDSENAV